MRERRRDYELMFIISPLRSSEEDIAATIGRVQQSITNAGGEVITIDHTPPWGRRKFAYPIREYAEGEASRRSFNEGYYVLLHFKLSSTRIPDVERTLKLSDSIIRYLLTLVETQAQLAPVGATVSIGAGSDLDDDSDIDDDDLAEELGEDEDE